jgi:hypothetical protein
MSYFTKSSNLSIPNLWSIKFNSKKNTVIENLIPGWTSEFTDDFCSKKIICKSPLFDNGIHIEIYGELFYNKSYSDYFDLYMKDKNHYNPDRDKERSIVVNVKVGSCSENMQKSMNCFSLNENGFFLKINTDENTDILKHLINLQNYIDLIKSRLIMEAMS